ncbi:MAG: hypothetical protein II911_04780 [Clostridia bacterium]|jgi:Predicted solute binding protein|nr:hypothetical protein [Clostridia bacterium]MBQ3051560.1 hypothetical protein [Clostridia bacterium]MBQ4459695.1 hypothetical protein [Clostridia bacterium]MBQ7229038.1 hypothetical protein [Clostridia bacterium]MBR0363730.1 hypothetical protein [Clostridia bacterium]
MKKILSVLLAVMMMMACSVTAFAADGDDDESSTVRRIPDGTKVVTSNTLDDGVIERLRVKTIYVPSSVTTITDGALTGYANVTNVYVENSKDNISIASGALPAGTNIVYTEKPTTPPTTTTTTKKEDESTTKTTKKDEETTTKKDEESTTKKTTTTKKGETTKKTTKKTTKRTVSSSATTSDPKNRTTVQHRPLTIPSTKAKKTTVKGPLIPEVEVDPEEIKEQPDPTMVADTTTVTFAGEAITDKDGTIIGFEDPQANRSDADRAATRAKIITAAAVGVVGLTSAAFVFLKLRRRP